MKKNRTLITTAIVIAVSIMLTACSNKATIETDVTTTSTANIVESETEVLESDIDETAIDETEVTESDATTSETGSIEPTPTTVPTTSPNNTPTTAPTVAPTTSPTVAPIATPTETPASRPTNTPTPTTAPTIPAVEYATGDAYVKVNLYDEDGELYSVYITYSGVELERFNGSDYYGNWGISADGEIALEEYLLRIYYDSFDPLVSHSVVSVTPTSNPYTK